MIIRFLMGLFDIREPNLTGRHLHTENLSLNQRWLEAQYRLLKAKADPLANFKYTDKSRKYHLNVDATRQTPWVRSPVWPHNKAY